MSIRTMEQGDVQEALRVINHEGWGYTTEEIVRMLRLEPEGSFILTDEGIKGVVTSVIHGNTGVIGHLVVRRESRGKGMGRKLLEHAMGYFASRGVNSTLVYATDKGTALYRRLGFRVLREVLCKHSMNPEDALHDGDVRTDPLLTSDLENVIELDERVFGEDRSVMLKALYDEFPQACFKIERRRELTGFCMGRRTTEGYDLGPWMTTTGSSREARALLMSTLSSFGPGRVFYGMFNENRMAVEISEGLPLYRVWQTRLMGLGDVRSYKDVSEVYGIAAFELG